MTGSTIPENAIKPLQGMIVIDLTRMLPGAVLARMLLDLGARVIKIEQPYTGDIFRHAPPVIEGISCGFRAFFRGAESVCLDLGKIQDAKLLRELIRRVDVVIESFRPGTLARWNLGPDRLMSVNPRLIICSLTGYGQNEPWGSLPGHDLNFVAMSGLLSLTNPDRIPRTQFSDISGSLLGCSAILAALLRRERTGQGCAIEQPLAFATLPFLAWNMAELAAGTGGVTSEVLDGSIPAYHIYTCGDGQQIALAVLESKFWRLFLAMTGLERLAPYAWSSDDDGQQAIAQITARLLEEPREHWLGLAMKYKLPLSPVNDVHDALAEPVLTETGALIDVQLSTTVEAKLPGPFIPSLGCAPTSPAPHLGEHTERVLREFGLERNI